MIHEAQLDQKLEALERARAWSPRVISKLENTIRAPEDWDLFRINPLRFGKDKAIAENEAIDLFLHATKVGLFDMNWHLLCPGCTIVVESFRELNTMEPHFHCDL